MKSVMRGLALAAALLVPVVSQAELVIDNFVSPASTGVVSTSRSTLVNGVSRVGISGTNASIFNNGLSLNTGSVNAFAEFTVSVLNNTTGLLTPGALGFNHYLRLADLAVTGNWNVQITATGTGGTSPGSMTVSYVDGTTGDQIVNLTGLSNVGNLNGLQSLKFRFTAASTVNDGLGGQTANLSLASIAAVPEPASMLLLGSTAIGGLIFNRRRKKALAV